MNHIYRSIWSQALGVWVAVPENTKGKAKNSSKRNKSVDLMTASPSKDWQSCAPLLATGLLLCSSAAWALPTGEQLVAGQATVNTPIAGQMQIDQSSQQAIINWQGFSIAPNEAVNIQQPNAQAALLNRVVGQDASQIQGQLHANGQVYLVNPNGVLFGKTAQVDVGGLIASTHNIKDADFLKGVQHFTQDNATGTVSNQGTIQTPDGGVVAFIGNQVSNGGTINTPKGTTALAVGKTVDLDFTGNGLIEVKVTEAALNAQITNQGAMQADGGRVVLTAKAAGQLIDTVINQAGIIRAQGMIERNGEIILDGGDNGTVQVSGTVDTSTNQGLNTSTTGGNITVKGADIQLVNGANVTASGNTDGGTITIGDKQSTQQTTIAQGATVTAQTLDSGTAGTIKVFANMDSGTVNVAGKLDASAPNNGDGGFIDTSAAHVSIADTAKISTLANNGKTGTWLIDPVDFTITAGAAPQTIAGIGATTLSTNLGLTSVVIVTVAGAGNGDIFVNGAVNWSANTLLTLTAARNTNINADINATGTTAGVALNPASGNYFLNGGGITLSGASASFAVNGTAYTLIHDVNQLQAMNSNLGLNYALGVDIDASAIANFVPVGNGNSPFTGNFAGLGHTISNLTVNSPNDAGLFGSIQNTTSISNVGLLNANITGLNYVGALVGESLPFGTSTVSNSYATGSVTATGTNPASSAVAAGGLIGRSFTAISNSYANVNVTSIRGGIFAGGLVGEQQRNISNSYATGSVNGATVGGLVGYLCNCSGPFSLTNSYAAGKVTGSTAGGLIGLSFNSPTINNSFWDTQTTGRFFSAGGLGKTTAQLMAQSTYTGWDFTNTWWMSDTNTRPFLRMEYSTNIRNAHQLQLMAMDLTANYTLANNLDLAAELTAVNGQYPNMWSSQGFVPVGNYTTNFTGKFDGLGYTISGLTINRSTTDFVGLFGINTGSIRDVGMINVGIIGRTYVGGLVAGNTGSISNAYATGTVTGNDLVGGLVEANEITGTVTNVYTTGSVSGITWIGGVVGYNVGNLTNAYFTGSVSGNGTSTEIGGLAGYNYGNITNAYSTGSVSGTSYVGGLVGLNDTAGIVTNAYATGNVSGTTNVGGLVGNNNGSISNTNATGNVNGTTNGGGLVGYNGNGGSISSANATGNVSGTNYVGGLVGYNDTNSLITSAYATGSVNGTGIDIGGLVGYNNGGNISNANATGNISGTGNFVGGLVGNNNGSISDTNATGSVNGTDYIGGLVGWNDTNGIVTNAYATGSVNGTGIDIGGLGGRNYGSINNVYATGSVSGTGFYDVGGLVGWNYYGGIISNAYATGIVNGTSYVGGLVGDNGGSISKAYATANVTGNGFFVGGLAGNNDGNIDNADATGNVNGTSNVGGLVGNNYGSISNAYATANATGNGFVGGLVGENDGIIG